MLLVVVCGFLAVALLTYALVNRPLSVAQQRLAMLGMAQPDRALVPGDDLPDRRELLLNRMRSAMPARHRERLERLLTAAGSRMRVEVFILVCAGTAVGLPLLVFMLGGATWDGLGTLTLMLALGGLGAYLPVFRIRSRASKRRKKILRLMPDMMDLLTTCVEAGLGLDAALARVGEQSKEPLGGEIRATLGSIAMGTSRRQALERLAARNDVPELTTFVTSLVQTESMGTSLGTALRVQAEAVRVARKQRAEQQAQKAPIKIIVVLALLVFPSMFAVILGPAVIAFIQRGGLI